MNLLGDGQSLSSIKGKKRVALVDYRPPLSSPITVLVMLLKAAGFEWWGADKKLPDGSSGTSCFIDTLNHHPDGTGYRHVVWTFSGDHTIELGGDEIGIYAIAHFFGYSPFANPGKPIPRGALSVLSSVRDVAPLTGEMPFNARGKALLEAVPRASHKAAQLWLADAVDLYRGFCWKLSTPIDHPPHPDYGYPLDRHFRYRKGKRKGDVRQSLVFDERMDELKVLGLR